MYHSYFCLSQEGKRPVVVVVVVVDNMTTVALTHSDPPAFAYTSC